jgi:hypothetical protein
MEDGRVERGAGRVPGEFVLMWTNCRNSTSRSSSRRQRPAECPFKRPAECLLDVQLECSWKRDMHLDGKALALKMLLRAEISASSLGSWTLSKNIQPAE